MTNCLTMQDVFPSQVGADSKPRLPAITAFIDVQYGCVQGLGSALTAVVRSALVAASGADTAAVDVRFTAHDPETFILPPFHTPLFILVRIGHPDGATASATKAMHRAVFAAISGLGIPREDILILDQEPGRGTGGDGPRLWARGPGFRALPSEPTETIP